jgi:alpha-L-fucosidase
LHENDVQSLMEWKKLIDQSFKINPAANAIVQSSSTRGSLKSYGPENVLDGNKENYWTTDDHIHTGYLEINLGKPQKLNFLVIQEYIKLGQRVKSFTVEVWKNNSWKQVAMATTIGYKRILKLNGTETSKLRVTINDSKACPVISSLEVF